MSLILEALRKSEAERQRGRLPVLATELPPAPAPRPVRAPAWTWALLASGALALAFAAWLAGAGWMRTDAASAPPAPMPRPPATASADAVHVQPRALPPIVRLTPPPAPARTTVARAAHEDDAPPTSAPLRATPTATAADAARARVAAAAARTSTAPPVPVAAPAPERDAILSLADLDPDTRKALPPLHLSMHLWDADPSRRFVILDGNRLGEGDRIGPAVLTAITRDGVLLDWNGRRIRVPLR